MEDLAKKEIKLRNRTVTMREPRLMDFLAAESVQNPAKVELMMISNCTEIPEDDLKMLALKDYYRLVEGLEDFLPDRLNMHKQQQALLAQSLV
jgi:hypothetical protein